jgi:hypothetical protein
VDRPPRSRQPVVISLPKSKLAADQLDTTNNTNHLPSAFANFTYNDNENVSVAGALEGLSSLFFVTLFVALESEC